MPASHYTRLCVAITTVWLSTLMIACQPVRPVTTVLSNPDGVIFTARQSEAERSWINAKAEGTWTPVAADIARLEEDLLPFLRQAQHPWLRPDPPIWERASGYKRQYLGLIVAGERVIYANFFCQIDDGMDWQHKFVFVLDGGDCYFRVTYNPATGEFYNFDVNGES